MRQLALANSEAGRCFDTLICPQPGCLVAEPLRHVFEVHVMAVEDAISLPSVSVVCADGEAQLGWRGPAVIRFLGWRRSCVGWRRSPEYFHSSGSHCRLAVGGRHARRQLERWSWQCVVGCWRAWVRVPAFINGRKQSN